MDSPIVAPSLLSADFADMGAAAESVAAAEADWIHLDVMDGRFVPNLTFGPKMLADLRVRSGLPFDAHLMTVEPERLVPAFIEAGADWITFHLEACTHAHRLVQAIRERGVRPGISIVPSTPASALEELLPVVDLVLVMTVNPGFGGQALIPACLGKVEALARERERRSLEFLIAVDGGINRGTLGVAARSGADVLVMGSAFFASADRKGEVEAARSAYATSASPGPLRVGGTEKLRDFLRAARAGV